MASLVQKAMPTRKRKLTGPRTRLALKMSSSRETSPVIDLTQDGEKDDCDTGTHKKDHRKKKGAGGKANEKTKGKKGSPRKDLANESDKAGLANETANESDKSSPAIETSEELNETREPVTQKTSRESVKENSKSPERQQSLSVDHTQKNGIDIPQNSHTTKHPNSTEKTDLNCSNPSDAVLASSLKAQSPKHVHSPNKNNSIEANNHQHDGNLLANGETEKTNAKPHSHSEKTHHSHHRSHKSYSHEFLDLSPIKRPHGLPKLLLLPTKPFPKRRPGLPKKLPTLPRKRVAFSDNIASDDFPDPFSDNFSDGTPQKSILKRPVQALVHCFSAARSSPGDRAFWHAGTIVLLAPRLPDLPELVAGCAQVLADPDFDRKFEVYATLSHVCKSNDASTLTDLLVRSASRVDISNDNDKSMAAHVAYGGSDSLASRIVDFARRDVLSGEARLFRAHKNDPFQARILGQALKTVAFFFAVPAVNNALASESLSWFYGHACDMLAHQAISKSLVLPYLCLLKECHYSARKRPQIFSEDLPDRMLSALLAVRSFPSSLLVNEKFSCLKTLVLNFSEQMAARFDDWFAPLLADLCNLSDLLHVKIAGSGITTLLEAARTYLDTVKVSHSVRAFLGRPFVPTGSFVSESANVVSEKNSIDYVCSSLKTMIDSGHYKFAMDIWVGLSLLISHAGLAWEQWEYLPQWLLVHRHCFNVASVQAKTTALSSWKVVIYKVCCVDLQNPPFASLSAPLLASSRSRLIDEIKPKLKLLIHLFVNIISAEYRPEVTDALHHSFLSILYNLLGPLSAPLLKMLSAYWERIFVPVFAHFYFNKESANPQMHRLGAMVLLKLLKPTNPVNEKNFAWTRCLSNEAISLSELNSFSPRWVYLQFENIMPLLATICKLEHLETEQKLTAINGFLSSIKYITKKEIQPSNTTLDLVDNLPYILQPLFESSEPSYDEIFKLIVTLNDTFGAPHLVAEAKDGKGTYQVILSFCALHLTSHQMNAIMSMLHGTVGERKSLLFLSNLTQLSKSLDSSGEILTFVEDCLNNKKYSRFSHQDMILLSSIFESLDKNFATVAKKLIQQIVLLKAEEFEKIVNELRINHWNILIFKFFIILMHDAPFDYLKRVCVKLIRQRLQLENEFEDLFVLLLENRFDFEIHTLKDTICERLASFNSEEKQSIINMWHNYLSSFSGDMKKLDDLLTTSHNLGLDIKSIVKNRWETFPNLKKAWLKTNDALFSSHESDTNVISPEKQIEQLTTRQVELESIIASDMLHHATTKTPKLVLPSPTVEEEEPVNICDSADTSDQTHNATSVAAELEMPFTEQKKTSSEEAASSVDQEKRFVGQEKSSSDDVQLTYESNSLEHATESNNTKASTDTTASTLKLKRPIESASTSRRRSKRIQTRRAGEITELSSDASIVIEISSDAKLDSSSGAAVSNSLEKPRTRSNSPKDTSFSNGQSADSGTKQVSDSDESSRLKEKDCSNDVEGHIEIASSVDYNDRKNGTFESSQEPSFLEQSMIINTSNDVLNTSAESIKRLSVVEEIPSMEAESGLKRCTLYDVKDWMNNADLELAQMSPADKYELETEMMRFILRMRQAS